MKYKLGLAALLLGTTLNVSADGAAHFSPWESLYGPNGTSHPNKRITALRVSNISSANSVEVTIKLKNNSGASLFDSNFMSTLITQGFESCSAINVCILNPGKTASFVITGGNEGLVQERGYGTIEWRSMGQYEDHVALIVGGHIEMDINRGDSYQYNSYPVEIHADQPF